MSRGILRSAVGLSSDSLILNMGKKVLLLLALAFVPITSCSDPPSLSLDDFDPFFGGGNLSSRSADVLSIENDSGLWICTMRWSVNEFVLQRSWIEAEGFTDWRHGGITYGGIDKGWNPGEELLYAHQSKGGRGCLVAYDKKSLTCYFIVTKR